jgi:hypothetical protein
LWSTTLITFQDIDYVFRDINSVSRAAADNNPVTLTRIP